MTRLEKFKAWLRENGAEPADCELLDDMGHDQFDPYGCYGFVCPNDTPVEKTEVEDTTIINTVKYECELCKYYRFWSREEKE